MLANNMLLSALPVLVAAIIGATQANLNPVELCNTLCVIPQNNTLVE